MLSRYNPGRKMKGTVLMSGRVEESGMHVNEKTNDSFCWARLQTKGGMELDAVLDPKCLGYRNSSLPGTGGGYRGHILAVGAYCHMYA